MEEIIYHSPISGEKLTIGSDGLLHSIYNDITYMINSTDKVIPLISPLDASPLYLGKDGLFESKYDDVKYKVNDGKIIPLISPIHKGRLIKDDDGLYSSPYDQTKYMVSDNGDIKPLIDPLSGGNLKLNEDGTYQSLSTGKTFMFNQNKDAMIPLYVPDNTEEEAYIENEMLVGKVTGRKFEIDSNGIVLTPEEIKFREIKQQETEKFQQMEEDGTIEDYLDKIDEKKKNIKPLSIDDMREIINKEDPKQDIPETPQDKPIREPKANEAIEEFLISNNIKNEKDFTDYLINLGMDKNIIKCLEKVSPTKFLDILLQQDINSPISIINKENGNKELYVPTTINSQISLTIEISKDGNLKVIDNHHSPLIVDGIRYGNVGIVEMSVNEDQNLDVIESNHEVRPYDGLTPIESKIRFEASSSKCPVLINSNGEIKQGKAVHKKAILDTAQDGVLKPIQDAEELKDSFQQIKDLGFDEKYFTKPNIAGINYDINGNEIMYENENKKLEPKKTNYIVK